MSVTNAALRARVHRIAKQWVPILGLESWGLAFLFDEPTSLATCSAKPAYEEAVVRFNLPRIKRELPNIVAALDELVLHELTHAVIWRASERAVSQVTRAILRARDAA